MNAVANLFVALVGIIHVYVFVLEAVLWTKPYGMRVFRMDPAKAEATRTLALNQGFYNLFLAAGLFWALASGAELAARASFFLLCVAIAGVVGGITVSKRIIYVQTVPAVLGLIALFLAHR